MMLKNQKLKMHHLIELIGRYIQKNFNVISKLKTRWRNTHNRRNKNSDIK